MILLYGLEVMKLHLGMYACFDARVRYPWGQAAGGICCGILAVLLRPSGFPESVTAALTAAIVTFICAGGSFGTRLYQVIVLFVLSSGLGEMLDGPRSLYQILNGFTVQQSPATAVINQLLCCGVFLAVGLARKKMPEKTKEIIFEKVQKILPLLLMYVSFNVLLLIAFLGIVMEEIQDPGTARALGVFEFVSFSNLLLLACLVLWIWETNRKMDRAKKDMEGYRQAEKMHYEMLLENEKTTRKYRHDMKNHLICMEQLAREGDWAELKQYLSGLGGQMEEMSRQYETGNRIFDIISNYHLSSLPEGIDVRMYGGVGDIGRISQEDLCRIYANLLQNAVEELQRKKDGDKGFLHICFSENERFLQMEMENSLAGPKQDLRTQKEDADQHGYGIANVKETVEKYQGEVELKIRENSFYVSVILPMS